MGVVTNSLAANDVAAVHSGYAEYRDRLLRRGVQPVRAARARASATAGDSVGKGASLHTKAFVLDDARGFVGSFNVDPRSKNLNTEMGVLFDDPVIAAQLRDEYLRLTDPAMSYWVYRDPMVNCAGWTARTQPPVGDRAGTGHVATAARDHSCLRVVADRVAAVAVDPLSWWRPFGYAATA